MITMNAKHSFQFYKNLLDLLNLHDHYYISKRDKRYYNALPFL